MGATYGRAQKEFMSQQTPRWLIRRMITDSEKRASWDSLPWISLGASRNPLLSKLIPGKKKHKGPWTEQEDEYILRCYVKFGGVRVASVLKRPLTAVGKRARQLGLKMRNARAWSNKEVEYVRRHCMKEEELAEIARHLGRTEESVKQRARRLGFRKFVQPKNADEG